MVHLHHELDVMPKGGGAISGSVVMDTTWSFASPQPAFSTSPQVL